jgi:WD40 repeat protein
MSRVSGRKSLQVRWTAAVDDHVAAIDVTHAGDRIAASGVTGPLAILHTDDGKTLDRRDSHPAGIATLAWSPTASQLATGGLDGAVCTWDGSHTTTLQEMGNWVTALAWHPDGSALAWCAGRTLALATSRGDSLWSAEHPQGTIMGLAWSPSGDRLASVAYGGITIRSPDSADPLIEMPWTGSGLCVAWGPNGRFLAAGDQDSCVYILFASSGKRLQMWGFDRKVRELAWDSSGRWLATGGGCDPTVWDTSGRNGPEGRSPITLEGHGGIVRALAWSPAASLLASTGDDGTVCLWAPRSSSKPVAIHELTAPGAVLRWLPDGSGLVVGDAEGGIAVLEQH